MYECGYSAKRREHIIQTIHLSCFATSLKNSQRNVTMETEYCTYE